ncbi:hypothetical protein DDI_0888 [Dickeya dianthicola RNS04.9]|nr:hypothetical protein DDI_0888 [Dickeya dianthicola RNS04.9]
MIIRIRADKRICHSGMPSSGFNSSTLSTMEKRNAAQQDTGHFLLFPLSKTMI